MNGMLSDGDPGPAEGHTHCDSSLERNQRRFKIACLCHCKSLMLLMKILPRHEIFSV